LLSLSFYLLQSAFLPQGYPESVSKDYLEYQVWDTMQVCNDLLTPPSNSSVDLYLNNNKIDVDLNLFSIKKKIPLTN